MKAVSSTNGCVVCGERVRVEYLPTEDKKEYNLRLSSQGSSNRGRSPSYSHHPVSSHHRRTPPPPPPPPRPPSPPHRSTAYHGGSQSKYSDYYLSPSHSRHDDHSSHRRSPPSSRGYSSGHSDYGGRGYSERAGHGNSYPQRESSRGGRDRVGHYGDHRERRGEEVQHKRSREGYVVDRYVNKHASETRPPPPPPPPHRSHYSHRHSSEGNRPIDGHRGGMDGHRDGGRRPNHFSPPPPPPPPPRDHDYRYKDQHYKDQHRPPPPPPPPLPHRNDTPHKHYHRDSHHGSYSHTQSSDPRPRSASGQSRRHSDHSKRQAPPPRHRHKIDIWKNPDQPRKHRSSHGRDRGQRGGGGRQRRDRSRSPHYNNRRVDPNEYVFFESKETQYITESSPPSVSLENESQQEPSDLNRDEDRFSNDEYEGDDCISDLQSPRTPSVDEFPEQGKHLCACACVCIECTQNGMGGLILYRKARKNLHD